MAQSDTIMVDSGVIDEGLMASSARPMDYFSLLKPRVMSLVVFTGVVGFWLAPARDSLHPFLALIGILALALGAGAAGAFNMWYDRDIDAVMLRTKNRPVPSGRVAPDDALGFAIFCSLLAFMMMGLATNWLAAGILAFASFFYSVIYTVFLKRSTAQNIVIGGAAGAFPPVIGWAMAAGGVSFEPILLFLLIFLWTPPHFWALALFSNEDYKRAGVPMLPLVSGVKSTKIHMMAYCGVLGAVSILPYFLGYQNSLYLLIAAVLNFIFVASAVKVWRSDDLKDARRMFGFSIFYLFAIFLALMVCHT